MSHENSVTVQQDGRWFVKDNSGDNKGKILGAKKGYDTLEQANSYAKNRSENFGGTLGRFFK